MDAHAGEPAAIVNETDGHVVAVAQDIPQQHFAAVAGADDQNALTVADIAQVQAAILGQAIQQTGPAQQAHEEHRVDDHHRARNAFETRDHEQRKCDGERTERGAAHDIPQILQARETPEAAIQPKMPRNGALHAEHHRQGLQAAVEVIRGWQPEVEARQQRQHPRQRDHDQIMRNDDGSDVRQTHVRGCCGDS